MIKLPEKINRCYTVGLWMLIFVDFSSLSSHFQGRSEFSLFSYFAVDEFLSFKNFNTT